LRWLLLALGIAFAAALTRFFVVDFFTSLQFDLRAIGRKLALHWVVLPMLS